MQTQPTPKKKLNSATQGFMTIGTLYSYLYCMLASSVIVSLPILGGSMYLVGYIALMVASLRRTRQKELLSRSMRVTGTILLVFLFLALLALITIFPIQLESGNFWRLSAIVLD